MERTSAAQAVSSWREEKQSAFLYRVVEAAERGTPREALFAGLAEAAEAQAEVWAAIAARAGAPPPGRFTPSMRARVVAALVRAVGPSAMRPVLAAMKVRGVSAYAASVPSTAHHAVPDSVEELRSHHGTRGGGNLRAAVFGVNDGLVSNATLILGVAGAATSHETVLLAGLAGLLAGALSMAAGEYVSVRSQREMYEYQIGLERAELAQYPEDEAAELALIYRTRGLGEAEATQMARQIVADPERALRVLAREELGVDPEDLGSPWGAAVSSFVSFALGGAVPVLPFLAGAGALALPAAIGLTALSLFGVGAALSLFTGRGAVRGGLRMLGVGGGAGVVAYLIGHVVGAGLA
ncbi:MAG TPA: VIT1/CCC1 transporter family protein [Thermodesulfobacteriota bacterium]